MSRHRQERLRPRYGRLAALGSSLSVTVIAVLGGTGVLPSAAGDGAAPGAASAASGADALEPVADPGAYDTDSATSSATSSATADPTTDPTEDPVDPADDTALPADSGTGKRVVFSEGRQRVWLVSKGTRVERTYLVSGSLYDNLDPGTYAVYSRSEHAYGIDDSGTMRYFVRFTQGESAAIGFHDIPVADGERVQSVAELGTPQSHGCIRQRRADAIALWDFAPIGTTVVVTA